MDRPTFARTLTEREMKRLETKIMGSVRDAEQVIIEFYDIALADRDSSYENESTIEPTDFHIPEEQWKEIAGWLQSEHPIAGGSPFNGALSWMNSGPSAYATIDAE